MIDLNYNLAKKMAYRVADPNNGHYYSNKKKLSVLTVDDDPQFCRVVVRFLNPNRFSIICSNGIDDALDFLDYHTPDIILLDLHRCDGDNKSNGIDILKKIRTFGYRKPVIIMSTDGSFENAHEAAKHGANGYIVKNSSNCYLDQFEYLINNQTDSTKANRLPPAAIAYIRSQGLSDWDVQLLKVYVDTDFEREKEISRILNRNPASVRKQFQMIRSKLGAKSQVDLGRILGVLSCFNE